jgi:membrane-associated phospholipid phosphatase
MVLLLLLVGAALPSAPPESSAFEPDQEQSKSVYRISSPVDPLLISAGAAAAIVPYTLTSQWVAKRCPCEKTEVNRLDRSVIGNDDHAALVLSSVGLGVIVGALPLLDALELGLSRPLLEDVTVYVESLALNLGAVGLVKHIVQRPEPITYQGGSPRVAAGYLSFYSAHTATAFSALATTAITIAKRYRSTVWPWIAMVVLGGAVGYGTVVAGAHFYTDVLVGAAAGTAIGTAVPLLHSRAAQAPGAWRLSPVPGGLALTFP